MLADISASLASPAAVPTAPAFPAPAPAVALFAALVADVAAALAASRCCCISGELRAGLVPVAIRFSAWRTATPLRVNGTSGLSDRSMPKMPT